MNNHLIPAYLANPPHKISICVVGAGGTGSQVLTCLARMNSALIALQHPGLHITVIDDDIVTNANLGRQLFSPSELGLPKATALINRINRFFNLNWECKIMRIQQRKRKTREHSLTYNIIISCVDSIKAREAIWKHIRYNENHHDFNKTYYWLDFGNTQNTGQVVLSNGTKKLPNIFEMFPNFKNQKSQDSGPSCSLADALLKQDLFINSILAQLGCDMLWKLLKMHYIEYNALFLNLSTMKIKTKNFI